MRVIGLMSGTSHDAIDAAAADLNLVGDSLVLKTPGLVSEARAEALRQARTAMAAPADRELSGCLPGERPRAGQDIQAETEGELSECE
ncbi:hypothetical protein ACWCQZ_37745 [Streptomyces sp. NPDC002285]